MQDGPGMDGCGRLMDWNGGMKPGEKEERGMEAAWKDWKGRKR